MVFLRTNQCWKPIRDTPIRLKAINFSENSQGSVTVDLFIRVRLAGLELVAIPVKLGIGEVQNSSRRESLWSYSDPDMGKIG